MSSFYVKVVVRIFTLCFKEYETCHEGVTARHKKGNSFTPWPPKPKWKISGNQCVGPVVVLDSAKADVSCYWATGCSN